MQGLLLPGRSTIQAYIYRVPHFSIFFLPKDICSRPPHQWGNNAQDWRAQEQPPIQNFPLYPPRVPLPLFPASTLPRSFASAFEETRSFSNSTQTRISKRQTDYGAHRQARYRSKANPCANNANCGFQNQRAPVAASPLHEGVSGNDKSRARPQQPPETHRRCSRYSIMLSLYRLQHR